MCLFFFILAEVQSSQRPPGATSGRQTLLASIRGLAGVAWGCPPPLGTLDPVRKLYKGFYKKAKL